MHDVYLLESENDPAKRCLGFTDDLKQRLADHNAGKSKHTLEDRPWRLSTYTAFSDREKALAFERYLKIGSGHAFAQRHIWK